MRPLRSCAGTVRGRGAPAPLVGLRHGDDVFLAGTDCLAPFCCPGSGLHEERGLLVQAGRTPLEALQAATRNAAEFLGRQKDLGSVEAGELADLVLLDADPLADIGNVRKVDAVILGGRLLDRRALDRMLGGAERGERK